MFTLKSGEGFGDIAFLENTKRNATVKTAKDSHFLLISREQYMNII